MPSLARRAAAFEKARSNIDFALHKLEDIWYVEDALLSGATSLSEASSEMRKAGSMLEKIRSALVNAELNSDIGGDPGVEEWILAVEDAALQVEATVLNFLKEARRGITAIPYPVERISAEPVDLFLLYQFGIEMHKIESELRGISTNAVMWSLDTGTAARSLSQQAPPAKMDHELGLVGYGDLQKNIIRELLDQSTHPECLRIAITGPHGAGKTALAQKIYHSMEVKGHFEVCFWLFDRNHTDSSCPEQYETIDVLRKMLAKIDPSNCYFSLDNNEETEISLRLSESLKKKRYLVVVENILQYNEFRKALPDQKNGSRILIVTREIGYYEKTVLGLDPDRTYKLAPLSEGEKLQLLLRNHELEFQPDILQREIATRWGDIPKNMLLLGAHLQFNLSHSNDTQVLRDIDATAVLSDLIIGLYNYLPKVLQKCFACIAAVFPINYIIPADSVIQLWIAEGIILKETDGTLEDTAKMYLDELIQRGLMRAFWVCYHNQADQRTRVIVLDPELHESFNCYTHMNSPLFLETAETLMMALSLSTTSNRLLRAELLVDDACQLYSYYEDPVNFRPVRRLAVHLPGQFNSFEEGEVMQGFKYPRIQSLFVFGSVAPLMFSQFNFLRILAVYQARIRFSEEDRECWLDGLVNLRYLGFIVCWIEAGSLGKKLTRFRNLKTLDLSKSFVSGLSEFIQVNKKVNDPHLSYQEKNKVNVVGPANEEFGRWWSPVPDMCQ